MKTFLVTLEVEVQAEDSARAREKAHDALLYPEPAPGIFGVSTTSAQEKLEKPNRRIKIEFYSLDSTYSFFCEEQQFIDGPWALVNSCSGFLSPSIRDSGILEHLPEEFYGALVVDNYGRQVKYSW